MQSLEDNIASLLTFLRDETSEKLLLSSGMHQLDELRKLWKDHQSEFTAANVSDLKNAADQLHAVKSFLEEEDEFPYIVDSDDANDVIARLFPLMESLDGLSVAKRVEKEIRELIEQKKVDANKCDFEEVCSVVQSG